jgi:hypothetical protein
MKVVASLGKDPSLQVLLLLPPDPDVSLFKAEDALSQALSTHVSAQAPRLRGVGEK